MTHGPLGGTLDNFVYDSRSRIVQAGTTQYLYDAKNQRIGVDGTRFVVNSQPALSQVLVKTNADGSQTFYVYGLGLIGEESAAGYKAYHFDFRGSTVALSDDSGAVLERFSYSAYGILLSGDASQTPFLFNGMYGVMTDGNGLYHMRARFYSAEIRRFLNRDVLLGSVARGQLLNRFGFVTGSPISLIDPWGLEPSSFQEAAGMSFDWLLGTGPVHIFFGQTSNQARDMRDAPSINQAREFYLNKFNDILDCRCGGNDLTGYDVTNFIGNFRVREFFSATINRDATEHFVGRYRIDIYGMENGEALFVLNNTSSFRSFWYGILPDWSRDSFGPMGNMTQIISWTEYMKTCPWNAEVSSIPE
jgi:RHS repeat-associated protein